MQNLIDSLPEMEPSPTPQAEPPPSLPSIQSGVPTLSSSDCLLCKNTGIMGWKQPLNYPMNEVQFCACPRGEQVQEDWRMRANHKQQLHIDNLFNGAGIPTHFRDFTLDSLAALVTGEPSKEIALAVVKEFIEYGFVKDKKGRHKFGVIVSGRFGTGKTGMLTPVLRNFVAAGKVGLWIEAKEFVKEVQAGYALGDSEAKLEAAKRADIVLIDDLGDPSLVDKDGKLKAETNDRIEILYRLINHRHNHALPMLITTNLSGAELNAQIGERVFNRIIESCAWLSMAGKNLRME